EKPRLLVTGPRVVAARLDVESHRAAGQPEFALIRGDMGKLLPLRTHRSTQIDQFAQAHNTPGTISLPQRTLEPAYQGHGRGQIGAGRAVRPYGSGHSQNRDFPTVAAPLRGEAAQDRNRQNVAICVLRAKIVADGHNCRLQSATARPYSGSGEAA